MVDGRDLRAYHLFLHSVAQTSCSIHPGSQQRAWPIIRRRLQESLRPLEAEALVDTTTEPGTEGVHTIAKVESEVNRIWHDEPRDSYGSGWHQREWQSGRDIPT